MRAERSEMLVFDVYTGELKAIPVWNIIGPEGKDTLKVKYPDGCLTLSGDVQPRYGIEGNYIGFTHDDSGEILAPPTSPDKLAKELRKGMGRWVLIGSASVVLLIITALQIYYDLGYGTLHRFLAVVQFALLVTAIVFFMKTKRLLLSLRQGESKTDCSMI